MPDDLDSPMLAAADGTRDRLVGAMSVAALDDEARGATLECAHGDHQGAGPHARR